MSDTTHAPVDARPVRLYGYVPGIGYHVWWIVAGSEGADGPLYARACNRHYRVSSAKIILDSKDYPPRCRHLACSRGVL